MEETTKKTKRSVAKRAKLEAVKEAAKSGPATAYLRDVPSSPRKMRLVADMIRGVRVNHALNLLKYEAKHPSQKLEKLLLSAISNWSVKNADQKLEEADLFVKEIFVDGGRQLKRLRPAPQGRAHRIRKRSNHVTLVVDSMNPVVEKPKAKEAEEKKPKAKATKKPAKKAAKKKSTKKETKQ
ncbi:MAG TPA: 50S ribosomal protein L22 [Cyclobacteriaceae bacterium]|nr:50S ribosomal protein L22 [Cyclobacteriaceae bacterium]MCB9237238.1 50S ribosomal protein L22 [Flammeovirgaceae bacterium]MCB0499944.1 50S ribosomal protein L22 [Cyclobacteriaceae bacterium]MCO5270948.1 50S ribosomal protein L22 [Cyclobacteriaceae bacterium]MCW5901766.1 50S ribosomal protein L22 [Cyclobacteriaceae bacterium]